MRSTVVLLAAAWVVLSTGASAQEPHFVKDIQPTAGSHSDPGGFVEMNGELFFTVDDQVNGRELWKTDGTAPVISEVRADPSLLWPPNHEMIPVRVTVTATDDSGEPPVSRIVSVSCNEESEGDIAITGDLTLRLRAERLGTSTSRIYTIAVKCSDSWGNASTGTVTVTVPHDRGKSVKSTKSAEGTSTAPKVVDEGSAAPKTQDEGDDPKPKTTDEGGEKKEGGNTTGSNSGGKEVKSGTPEKLGEIEEQKPQGTGTPEGPKGKIEGDLGGK